MVKSVIRFLIGVASSFGGFYLSKFLVAYFWGSLQGAMWWIVISIGVLGFFLLGFMAAPGIMTGVQRFTNWSLNQLFKIPIQDIVGGAIGLIIGLFIANQIGAPLARIKYVGPYLSLAVSLFFGYLGLSFGIKKREEMLSFVLSIKRFATKEKDKLQKVVSPKIPCKVLDTSVIIDGRISDM